MLLWGSIACEFWITILSFESNSNSNSIRKSRIEFEFDSKFELWLVLIQIELNRIESNWHLIRFEIFRIKSNLTLIRFNSIRWEHYIHLNSMYYSLLESPDQGESKYQNISKFGYIFIELLNFEIYFLFSNSNWIQIELDLDSIRIESNWTLIRFESNRIGSQFELFKSNRALIRFEIFESNRIWPQFDSIRFVGSTIFI